MSDPIAEFCRFHHAYHDISPGRRLAQKTLLRQLETSLDSRPITSLEARDLERFLSTGGYAPSTIAKHINMIRPFAKWMWTHKHITGDRLMELRGVQAPRGANNGTPKPYSRAELDRFWKELDDAYPWVKDPENNTPKRAEYFVRRWQHGASRWHRVYPYARRLQAEAIISLALFGGLRRIEILNLELQDCHQDNAYVRVCGARKNPGAESIVRAVPMVPPMRTALGNWLEFRAQVLEPPHERPWLSLWRDGYLEPMTLGALGHLLDRVGDGYELHRMRHTFATERLRAGLKIEKLQRVLGHASVEMTLRYAQISDEDVLEEAELTNDKFLAATQRSEREEEEEL